jgi:integrase
MLGKISKRSVDALRATDRDAYLWDTEVTGFGVKATPGGRKVYLLQYRPRTQSEKEFSAPKRVTLGRHGAMTPEEARTLASNLLLEVKAGGDPAVKFRASDAPTVAALFERFLKEYLPGKKRPPRPSTLAYYEILSRCHVLPALGGKRVDAVTAADVERLHAAMRETPYVANRTLSLLQHAFDQAERWGYRPQRTNPALHVDRYREERRGTKKEVMLTPAQMVKLLDALEADAHEEGGSALASAALRVAFWTGWRIGEVLALEWANLDLERGTARLLKTKTAEEEYRQIPAEAVAILRGVPRAAGCPYVFPGQDLRGHLTTVRKPWARIRKRAGLAELPGLGAFRIHDLRHNVVSWDVSRGVALEIAGRNVGHRSRRSTEVYAHFAPDALKRAADERAAAMRVALETKREEDLQGKSAVSSTP